MNIRNILYGIGILLVMGTIFFFSHQPSYVSRETSGRIEKIVYAVIDKLHPIPEQDKKAVQRKISHIVRKTAHFSIYTALGMAVCGFLATVQKQHRLRSIWLISIVISMMYAVTDECHQIFVIGRSGELMDVAIDTAGSVLGATIMCGIWKYRRKKAN